MIRRISIVADHDVPERVCAYLGVSSSSANRAHFMQRRDLACAFYRRGVEAIGHAEWGRALELFVPCCLFDPRNVMYRQLAEKCSEKCNRRL